MLDFSINELFPINAIWFVNNNGTSMSFPVLAFFSDSVVDTIDSAAEANDSANSSIGGLGELNNAFTST